ncbi:hypothetical protein ARTHRO8AJ_300045 [Arthrobacter sp. 8AJ]|nr:hypothetical protein ARTHRO8AJ_300045 [Arthrobacter sp. 8AJ]
MALTAKTDHVLKLVFLHLGPRFNVCHLQPDRATTPRDGAPVPGLLLEATFERAWNSWAILRHGAILRADENW